MTEVHFTATHPTKRMAADCVFTDEAGRILLLNPPYKDPWDLPGGIVEPNESPRREVREELGLDVEPGRLLAVDWIPQSGDYTEIVAFLFAAGTLTPADINTIVLDPTEASAFRFVTLADAQHLLDPNQHTRLTAALTSPTTAYLENGTQT